MGTAAVSSDTATITADITTVSARITTVSAYITQFAGGIIALPVGDIPAAFCITPVATVVMQITVGASQEPTVVMCTLAGVSPVAD